MLNRIKELLFRDPIKSEKIFYYLLPILMVVIFFIGLAGLSNKEWDPTVRKVLGIGAVTMILAIFIIGSKIQENLVMAASKAKIDKHLNDR